MTKIGRNDRCPCGSGKKYKKCHIDGGPPTKTGDYFRLKGQTAEAAVFTLAERSFFTDWCYTNPRWPDGKELCDLLVVFDQTAIIWQIKDLALDKNGEPNASEVQKNLKQLAGARRHLFDLKRQITLSNPRRGSEVFDPSAITEVFLISALTGPRPDMRAMAQEHKTHTVHVMDREFLEKAMNELNTIADFTKYLRAKEALFQSPSSLMVMGGEEELLGYYLLNGRSFEDFTKYKGVVLEDGTWEQLLKHPQYLAKKKADEVSYGWDSIIDRAHEGSQKYENVARELARPNRFLRRYLARVFYEAHVEAHERSGPDCNVYRRVLPMDDYGTTYVFVFQERVGGLEARQSNLYATCLVARGRFRKNVKVIGIATEMRIRPTCSYDYCVLELPDLTPELEADIKTFEIDLGILQDVRWGRTEDQEYPAVESESPRKESQ